MTSSFVTHVLDLFELLGPSIARAMMGGHMISCCGLTVALIADERIFLKVDETTKETFARAGGEPFTYDRNGKAVEMSYWAPPAGTLDDPEEMRPWATLALDAAARAKKPGKKAESATKGHVGRSGSRLRKRRKGGQLGQGDPPLHPSRREFLGDRANREPPGSCSRRKSGLATRASNQTPRMMGGSTRQKNGG